MAHLFYGSTDPSPSTVEYPAAAAQVWAHAGANFCLLDGNGRVIPAVSGSATIFGYALIPKGTGAGSAVADWKASATEGADKLAVVLATDGYSFFVPADATATAGQAGDAIDLLNASATDSTAALADVGSSSTDVLIIQELATKKHADAAGTDIIVKINPAKIQAD